MKKIALIGSTGSIGKQTLSVVRRYPEQFKIVSLAAGSNVGEFLSQVEEFKPSVATLASETLSIPKSLRERSSFLAKMRLKKL